MSHHFIKQLTAEQSVDQVFLASEKQLRSNRQGNLYLQLRLSDRSGSVDARMWNANEEKAALISDGDYVRVKGTTQLFQGAIQLIIKHISKVAATEVDEADFRLLPESDIEKLRGQLVANLQSIQEENLRAVVDAYLGDEVFMDKFCRAPAGVKNHH